LGTVLFAGSALGQEQDPAKLAQAKKHMEAGAAFYNDPSGHKCEEASREFRKAYELSGSLNALKAMGVCALELERDGEAIAHFEKFLEKLGDKQHSDRAQVESDLKALRSAVAWVTVSTDRPNVRITDVRTPARGYPITNRYVGSVAGQKIGVHPGQHTFTASGDGVPDLVWRVDITNGSSHTHSFDFDTGKPVTAEGFRSSDLPDGGQPATHTERPIPITVWIFGGLTAALAVPTVIFMVSASGTASDFDEQNGRADEQTLEDLRSDVQTSNLVADIFLGATAASAAATLVFYFTRPEVQVQTGKATSTRGARGGPRAGATRRQDGAEASGRWRGVSLKPSFGPSGGGAMLTGRF
jgi:hypothetical protein